MGEIGEFIAKGIGRGALAGQWSVMSCPWLVCVIKGRKWKEEDPEVGLPATHAFLCDYKPVLAQAIRAAVLLWLSWQLLQCLTYSARDAAYC